MTNAMLVMLPPHPLGKILREALVLPFFQFYKRLLVVCVPPASSAPLQLLVLRGPNMSLNTTEQTGQVNRRDSHF